MTTSKQIIEVLDAIGDKLGIAIDWTSENVWPYLKEIMEKYVRYKIAKEVFFIIISLLVFTVIGIFATKCAKQHQKILSSNCSNPFWYYNDSSYAITNIEATTLTCAGIAASVVLGIVSILLFVSSINCLIACFTIPELVVLDYIKNLLSSI